MTSKTFKNQFKKHSRNGLNLLNNFIVIENKYLKHLNSNQNTQKLKINISYFILPYKTLVFF